MANRRMAIDAAEADIDVGGRMSYLRGAKLAFSDPKVSTHAPGSSDEGTLILYH